MLLGFLGFVKMMLRDRVMLLLQVNTKEFWVHQGPPLNIYYYLVSGQFSAHVLLVWIYQVEKYCLGFETLQMHSRSVNPPNQYPRIWLQITLYKIALLSYIVHLQDVLASPSHSFAWDAQTFTHPNLEYGPDNSMPSDKQSQTLLLQK